MSSMLDRALRVVRSNLSGLASRASSIGRGKSLEDLSDEELEAELERRRRENAARAAVEKARARAAEQAGDARPAAQAASASVVDLAHLPPAQRRQVRQYYANLELPFGASLDEVKHAYRRLMRQYHPDKHENDPARHQLATQLSQKLTMAYNELSRLLRS